MPPRRSRNRNPPHAQPQPHPHPHTSGTQPLLNRIEIRDQKRALLSSRGIVSGRAVNLDGLEEYMAREAFDQVGWSTFLEYTGNLYPNHVREFYAGFHFNEAEETIELQMYDTFHTWSLADFCTILRLPRDRTRYFTTASSLDSLSHLVARPDLLRAICRDTINPETTLHISDQSLLDNVKFWNKIVLANIFPRGGNTDRMAAIQAYLLYCLAQPSVRIDVGHIIVKRMDGIEFSKRKLPYGLLLNRLFEHLQLPAQPTAAPTQPLDATTVRRMDNARPARRAAPAPHFGGETSGHHEEDEPMPAAAPSASTSAPVGPRLLTYDEFHAWETGPFAQLTTEVRDMRRMVDEFQAMMLGQLGGQADTLETLRAYFQHFPPPS